MAHRDHFHDKQCSTVNGLDDVDMKELTTIIDKLKSLPSQTTPEGKALIASLENWCQKIGVKYKNQNVEVDGHVEDDLNPDVDNLGQPILPKK